MIALERAVDRIDCGPGRDVIVTLGQPYRVPPSCEELFNLREPERLHASDRPLRRALRGLRELRRFRG